MSGAPVGRRRRAWLVAVFWLLALALVAWTAGQISPAAVAAALSRLTPGELVALAGLNLFILLVANGRWWFLLRADGRAAPFLPLLGYRLASFAVSYITPGTQFGGEPLQVLGLVRKQGVPGHEAIAVVTLDRALELIVSFSFLLAAAIALSSGLLTKATLRVLPFVAILALTPLIYLAALWRGAAPLTWIVDRLSTAGRAIGRLADGARTVERQVGRYCRQRPGALAVALALSTISFGLLIVEYGLSLRFLDIDVDPVGAVTAFAVARLGLLAPTPGGLGALEAGQVLVLRRMGYNASVAASLLLIIRARDLILGLIGLIITGRILRAGPRADPAEA